MKMSVFNNTNHALNVDTFKMSFKEEAVKYLSRASRSSGQSKAYASLSTQCHTLNILAGGSHSLSNVMVNGGQSAAVTSLGINESVSSLVIHGSPAASGIDVGGGCDSGLFTCFCSGTLTECKSRSQVV